eukprot:6459373-Amphidinium_carterae.1
MGTGSSTSAFSPAAIVTCYKRHVAGRNPIALQPGISFMKVKPWSFPPLNPWNLGRTWDELTRLGPGGQKTAAPCFLNYKTHLFSLYPMVLNECYEA